MERVVVVMGVLCATACGFPRPHDIGDDAGSSSPPVCYGSRLVQVCFQSPPMQRITLSAPTLLDTDTSSSCAPYLSGGDFCVIAATDIDINGALRAKGRKPLVLIATGAITVRQLIDVGSYHTDPEFIGAGADPAVCTPGESPQNHGGGAGGSFAGSGGKGGNAAGAAGGIGGQPASAATAVSFRGGCHGQNGDGILSGQGGHGGGAVYLIAGTRIDIAGPGITAAGEAGGPGGPEAGNAAGAGGGGSGGMIGFDTPTTACNSLILASGGAGGEGSGTSTGGKFGADPDSVDAAVGGNGGSPIGGDGGNGSSRTGAGAGADGMAGTSNMGADGAGGGGGGGAGIILAPATVSLGDQVSPTPTP